MSYATLESMLYKHCYIFVIVSSYSFVFYIFFSFLMKANDTGRVKRIIINTQQNSETHCLVHCLFASSYYIAAMHAGPGRVSGHIGRITIGH